MLLLQSIHIKDSSYIKYFSWLQLTQIIIYMPLNWILAAYISLFSSHRLHLLLVYHKNHQYTVKLVPLCTIYISWFWTLYLLKNGIYMTWTFYNNLCINFNFINWHFYYVMTSGVALNSFIISLHKTYNGCWFCHYLAYLMSTRLISKHCSVQYLIKWLTFFVTRVHHLIAK